MKDFTLEDQFQEFLIEIKLKGPTQGPGPAIGEEQERQLKMAFVGGIGKFFQHHTAHIREGATPVELGESFKAVTKQLMEYWKEATSHYLSKNN